MSASSRFAERERGVVLHLLDLEPVEAAATESLSEDEKAEGGWLETGFKPWAMAENGGHLYVVCNEGVGWEVTDAEPLVVDLFYRSGKSFGIVPRYATEMTPEQVRRAATGENVDLADLIRTFGARLEQNFWTLRRVLTEDTTAFRYID